MIEDREEGARPRTANRFVPPATLDGWGGEELRAYVAALQAEIDRAEATITRQQRLRDAADAVFRKP